VLAQLHHLPRQLLARRAHRDVRVAPGSIRNSVCPSTSALQQLFAKTGVRTRSQPVRIALEK